MKAKKPLAAWVRNQWVCYLPEGAEFIIDLGAASVYLTYDDEFRPLETALVEDERATLLCLSLREDTAILPILSDRIRELGHERLADGLQLAAAEIEKDTKAKAKAAKTAANRRAREDAMQSLGLKKVRGARGGIYWE